jgi:hypothetical protein
MKRDKSMTYTLTYEGKEYTFQIDCQGNGRCICKGDVRGQLKREGKNLEIRGKLLGDKKALKRIDHLVNEFSVDVSLPFGLAQMIWRGWDAAGEATDATRAAEKEMDRLLIEVIEREYPT